MVSILKNRVGSSLPWRTIRKGGSWLVTTALLVVLFSTPAFAIQYVGLRVFTPKGSEVRALHVSGDLTAAERTAMDKAVKKAYPKAKLLTGSTARYNCHAYAWYSQATTGTTWINGPYPYWKDGSYKLRKSVKWKDAGAIPKDVANNAKVYYDGGNHSAVKTSASKFRSKWGQGPLMEHDPKYVPYGATKLNYYTK
ncbi:MAG: hypothetical protein LBJ02_02555 [Bifidobacteriaceae bacterium]|nr:hypothetical protein [Bifidobacteriaceae bacterium]